MMQTISRVLPFVGAGLLAYALFRACGLMLERPWGRYRRLAAVEERIVPPATFGSEQHRIRLAFRRFHLDVSGHEREARAAAYVLASILGFAFMRVGLLMSPVISILGFGLGYLVVNSLMEASWKKVQMEIDGEIPLFMTGFASAVQVQQDKLTAIYEEAQNLNPEGALRKWLLERFVVEYERYGQSIFPELIGEAFGISNSLGVMLYLIQRFWISGGDWGQAFAMGSENLESILDARIQGEAEGANARSSTLIIAALLVVVIVIMTRNPTTTSVIDNPLVQIGYVFLFGWMILGWKVLNETINEAF